MRIVPAAMAALLVTVAVAGCSGSGGSTARDGLGSAKGAAQQWSPDAAVVAVVALEVTDVQNTTEELEKSLAESEEPQVSDQIVPLVRALLGDGDSQPGDGYAPAWGYVFASTKGIRVIVVASSGSVTFNDDFPGSTPFEGATDALENAWVIDSDDAARIAAKENPVYAAALTSNGTQRLASSELHAGQAGALWNLFVNADGRKETAGVTLNATSGKVLHTYPSNPGPGTGTTGPSPPTPPPPPQPPEPVKQEAGTQEGSLITLIADQDDVTFDVADERHANLHLVLQATQPVGPYGLTAQATGPNGETLQLKAQGVGSGVTTTSSGDIPAPSVGSWTVHVTLDQGASQDYSVSWCTDGLPDTSTVQEPACQDLGAAARASIPRTSIWPSWILPSNT